MTFRLVDVGWVKELSGALRLDHSSIQIICPFIKQRTAERLIGHGLPKTFQVITRFNLFDFSQGVSDISALRLLLENGAHVRGVRNLHAKMYLVGPTAIVTLANLTEAALSRNHEFGFVAADATILSGCRQYFDDLWKRAGKDLAEAKLDEWERKVTSRLAGGARPLAVSGLGDEGVDAGISPAPDEFPSWVSESNQAFVKFWGESTSRKEWTYPVFEEVQRSGSHWACSYPGSKRPRSVRDGAIIFMGRMVENPSDVLIYGRAVGMRHVPGRDEASQADIQVRSWKAKWPHYIRVHHGEFLAGELKNGIPLSDLMSQLGADSFLPTQRNAAKRSGNTNPRTAYRQQAAVELSSQGFAWLNQRLEHAFAEHGKISPAQMALLDWPNLP